MSLQLNAVTNDLKKSNMTSYVFALFASKSVLKKILTPNYSKVTRCICKWLIRLAIEELLRKPKNNYN